MDLAASDPGPVKEDGPLMHCNYFDSEVVHKIAQLLLRGLAAASIDSTTGDLFRSPTSVAADMSKEMVEYLVQRSETFVDSDEGSLDPSKVISDFTMDFVTSRRNFLSRVSGWLLSETREEKINEYVQKMDFDSYWPIDKREAMAEFLLKNVDIRCAFHCSEKFGTAWELAEHRSFCKYRQVACTNRGCENRFSAVYSEKHDLICPFKVLPCEQQCQQSLMRSEMDRHCQTVCPMKLVNCPFYGVGCEYTYPQCNLANHCSQFVHPHLLCLLQVVQKHGASAEELKQRVQLLEKAQSLNELSGALDARSLTLSVKEQEARTKKLEQLLKEQDAKIKKLEQELSKFR